jgi:membrane protein implicated in regulation of membrane protease activity
METFLIDMYWGVAIFSSVLFAWQLLGTLFGHFTGGEHVDSGGADMHDVTGAAVHDGGAGGHAVQETTVHGADTVASFKLLSIRSVTAFGLLFGWAGVLYRKSGTSPNWTILYSVIWGFVGMLIVSSIFYLLLRMTETGTRRLATCVGQRGTVYMNIPAGGAGQVRVMVSGTISFISARAAAGEALPAGTPVVVKRLVDVNTVEVEKV